jgi:hypothetical protein
MESLLSGLKPGESTSIDMNKIMQQKNNFSTTKTVNQVIQERQEKERQEKERQEQERQEKERQEKERQEKERQEQERQKQGKYSFSLFGKGNKKYDDFSKIYKMH